MTERQPIESPPSQEALEHFIDRIREPNGLASVPQRSLDRLKIIVSMVRESAQDEWIKNRNASMAWYARRPEQERAENAKLPAELQTSGHIYGNTDFADEYHWLIAAVMTADNMGILSDADEASTRWPLVQAQKVDTR